MELSSKMVCKFNRFMMWKFLLWISPLLFVQSATCNPETSEMVNELRIQLNDMQVVLEKHEFKIRNYENENALLESRNTGNEMRISRLEDLLKKLQEINSKNEAKLGLLDGMKEDLNLLNAKNSNIDANIILCQFVCTASQEVVDGVTTITTTKATIPTPPKPTISAPPKQKSKVPLFHAKRHSVKGTFNYRIVTYESGEYNSGTMDLGSGIFAAPSSGTYIFEAIALKGILIQLNGNLYAWNQETHKHDHDYKSSISLELNAGDRVNLLNTLTVDPVPNLANWSVHLRGFHMQ